MSDYLIDSRLAKLTFMEIKRFLNEKGASKSALFNASSKFALVAIADQLFIPLEPLFAKIGPLDGTIPANDAAVKVQEMSKVEEDDFVHVRNANSNIPPSPESLGL